MEMAPKRSAINNQSRCGTKYRLNPGLKLLIEEFWKLANPNAVTAHAFAPTPTLPATTPLGLFPFRAVQSR
jgi:hypothetical protein